MKKTPLFYVISAVALLGAAAPVRAAEPHLLSVHENWSAYSFQEDGHKVCYMASQPKKMGGAVDKRGEVFALITDRPGENTHDVFSYIAGYTYKPGSDVTLTIDKDHFTLFTQDDTAWATDAAADGKITAALRKGKVMTVKGTPAHGDTTTDTFELGGTDGAHKAIDQECGSP